MSLDDFSFDAFKTKIVWGALTAIVAWLVFVTLRVIDMPNRQDVLQMLETQAPYARERLAVQNQFTHLAKSEERIGAQLAENARELRAMRIEIERLLVVKPADVYRKVEQLEVKMEHLLRQQQPATFHPGRAQTWRITTESQP